VFVRELMPQDRKIEVEQLTSEEAVEVAGFLAAVVGKAHGRQMDAETRKEWQLELQTRTATPRKSNNLCEADLKLNRLLNTIDAWAATNGVSDAVDPAHALSRRASKHRHRSG
jgi:uncharacterized protein (DUF2252 family)